MSYFAGSSSYSNTFLVSAFTISQKYPNSEKEIKFRRCLVTFAIKHEIRHFHVTVVQKRERNVQKKRDARAKLLFCLLNLLFLWRSRWRSRLRILKSLVACVADVRKEREREFGRETAREGEGRRGTPTRMPMFSLSRLLIMHTNITQL